MLIALLTQYVPEPLALFFVSGIVEELCQALWEISIVALQPELRSTIVPSLCEGSGKS